MKVDPELITDENPEWTKEDFANAMTFSQLPASLQSTLAELKKPSENFESATIKFDRDVLDAFRKTGADWQNQINHVLKQWLQEHPLAHSA